MSFDIDILITGDDVIEAAASRVLARSGDVQHEEVDTLSTEYVRVLKAHTPVGHGGAPGHTRLIDSYDVEPGGGANAASARITNSAPHLPIVLKGRRAVVPVRAKVLRWIGADGKPVFRMYSGPVEANPFDADARREMQGAIDGFGNRVAGRIVRLWEST